MKLKTLLALSFISLAIVVFGFDKVLWDVLEYFDLNPDSFGIMDITSDLISITGYFWKYGFLIFISRLFPKTGKLTPAIWLFFFVWCTILVTNSIHYSNEYDVAENWSDTADLLWNTTRAALFSLWVFLGGLLFHQVTENLDFNKFASSPSLKDWYLGLTK